MKMVNRAEYESARSDLIGRYCPYREFTERLADGRICKQYATEKNGTFYEITVKGVTEFWSDKHPESRYYDDRSRAELIAQYEDTIASLKNENADMIATLSKTNIELKEKLAAIQAKQGGMKIFKFEKLIDAWRQSKGGAA